MNVLKWLNDNIEKVIVVFFTAVLIISCSLGVISRYVFNMSLTWTEEVALFALLWLAYFGSAISVTRRRHLRIELLPMLLFKRKGQKIVCIITNIVFLGFSVFIAKETFSMMLLAKNTHQVFAATGIPRWTSIAAVPAAFLVMAIRIVQDTARQWQEYRAICNGTDNLQ